MYVIPGVNLHIQNITAFNLRAIFSVRQWPDRWDVTVTLSEDGDAVRGVPLTSVPNPLGQKL